MDQRTLAAISLSNRDYPSLDAKLEEAAAWVALAADQGAELVVLPEQLGQFRGDGPTHPHPPSLADTVLEDWQASTASLLDAARKAGVAIVVPVVTYLQQKLRNAFFVVSAEGEVLGSYAKMYPTPDEIDAGVVPAGDQPLIAWRGLRIGGAICFDTCFHDTFVRQARHGADMFVVPSLWPGGTHLNEVARLHGTPVVLAYPAWSRIIDAAGRTVAEGGYRHETLRFGFGSPIVLATLNFDRVTLYANQNQEKIVQIQRAFGDQVRITFDQPNCTFHLESLSHDVTAKQIVESYGLVPFQAYFEACERRRDQTVA